MTVVIKELRSGKYYVVVKGAAERIGAMCQPSSCIWLC